MNQMYIPEVTSRLEQGLWTLVMPPFCRR